MKPRTIFSSLSWVRTLAALFLFFMVTGMAYAGSFEASDWTREPTYVGKISQKLGFGFLNLTAGWTAIFFEPCKNQNFFVGVGKGIGYAFTNTAGGILHAATFPVPLDIPLPQGGIAYEYKR
jgi:Na+-driven multidrug efflux pump